MLVNEICKKYKPITHFIHYIYFRNGSVFWLHKHELTEILHRTFNLHTSTQMN